MCMSFRIPLPFPLFMTDHTVNFSGDTGASGGVLGNNLTQPATLSVKQKSDSQT